MSRAYTEAQSPPTIPAVSSIFHPGRAQWTGRRKPLLFHKAAVEMFTRVLAMELAPHHIRVNCIAPGLIDVRSEENPAPISEEYRRELLKTIPMGEAGKPGDIGDVAVSCQ